MHEIVTLQFGHRANYLATHFWNIQESYFVYPPSTEASIVDHDIHFRPGIGTDGSDTYTPRTVIYDFKPGFGTLRQLNALYEDSGVNTTSPTQQNQPSVWNDQRLTTIKQEPIQQTDYQRALDAGLPTPQLSQSDVRYWSDFNKVFLHPRSIIQLDEHSLNDSIRAFEHFSAGEQLFKDIDASSGGILDRDVRLFVEECDSIQGFQIFSGTDDAWGGWSERYVDALRDEYGKKAVWMWAVENTLSAQIAEQKEKKVARKANAAMSLRALGESGMASGYVRLATVPKYLPGYVKLDQSSEWQTAALMAAAIDSVSLPIRLRQENGIRASTMAQFEAILCADEGRCIWDLGLKLDTDRANTTQHKNGGRTNGNPLEDSRQRRHVNEDEQDQDEAIAFDVDFTPESRFLLPQTLSQADQRTPRKHVFAQIETARYPRYISNRILPIQPLEREELLRRRYNDQAIIEQFNIPLGFPLFDAFPKNLFNPSNDGGHSNELSLTTGLTTSSIMKQSVLELRDLVVRYYPRAIAVDEREELYNGLTEIGERYNFGWESDSDGEDE